MTQLVQMALISMLAGLFTAGIVWFGWDLVLKLNAVYADWAREHQLKAESEALLQQAEEPAEEERPA